MCVIKFKHIDNLMVIWYTLGMDIKFPKTTYDIVYADPPWRYRDTRNNDPGYGGMLYPTLSIQELCELPVRDISCDDSILFMWVTMPMLDVCFDVVRAWGFTYKTVGFVWVKVSRFAHEGQRCFLLHEGMYDAGVGLGSYTMPNAELCLIGTRGKFKRFSPDVRQVIHAPRGIHSQKPGEVRDRIVKLCGDVPRIELFARERVDGWDAWGNEV